MGHAKKPTILPPANEPINLQPLLNLPNLKQHDDRVELAHLRVLMSDPRMAACETFQHEGITQQTNPYCAIMPTTESPCNCGNKFPLKKIKLNPTIYEV